MQPAPDDKPEQTAGIVPALALVAVVAIAALSTTRRKAIRRAPKKMPEQSSEVLHAVPNVGIEDLTPGTLAWLRLYAQAAAGKGIPVTATSGRRSARRQAAAMLAKVERGEDLHALYRDDEQIDELLQGARTVDRWAAIIDGYTERGRGISNHLSGKAVDIRIRDWSKTQLQEAAALAVAMRAKRAIIESDHLHIEVGL
jgi:hypothetical protein